MPKVTNPLFSGDARGKFGNLFIFTKGGQVRRYFKPRNPNTLAQQAVRQAFKEFSVPSLTQEQADLLYAAISHLHDDRYSQLEHLHDDLYLRLEDVAAVAQAETNANDIYAIAAPGTASGFRASINGNPTNASNSVVVFDTVTLGAVGTIAPLATTQLAKLRLYNTTRGTYALILSATGSAITMASNVYAMGWRDNDLITTVSQTVVGGVYTWHDVEITSAITGKTRLFINLIFSSYSAGVALRLHPFTTSFSVSKYISLDVPVLGVNSYLTCLYGANSNVITFGWSGAPNAIYFRLAGYL